MHLGEARAGSECLLQCCLRGRLHRARVLRLGDNMGVVLPFGRKRASAFQLLCQVRRSAALELACEIGVRDRWFPIEMNPSDPPPVSILCLGPKIYGDNQRFRCS